MAGRGRGMVMPAWMKDKSMADAAAIVSNSSAVGASSATPLPMNSSNGDGRFDNASRQHEQQQQEHGFHMQNTASYDSYCSRQPYQQQQQPYQQQQQPPLQQQPPPMQRHRIAPDGWTEAVAEDGKVYYYNSRTQETTYDKPRSLMSETERMLPTSNWREYVRDGKSYFYNDKSKESVWEEPMEFTRYKEQLRALCSGEAPTKDMQSLSLYKAARTALDECLVGSAVDKETMEQRAVKSNKVFSGLDSSFTLVKGALISRPLFGVAVKDDGDTNTNDTDGFEKKTSAFKEMLRERRVPPGATWKEAIAFGIANDRRFYALLGAEQRQQVLQDYSSWARENAVKELRSILEALGAEGKLHGKSKLNDALTLLRSDDAAKAGLNTLPSKELEDLVYDYYDELYANEKEVKKKVLAEFSIWLKAVLEKSDTALPGSFKSFWSKNTDNLALLVKQPWFIYLISAYGSSQEQEENKAAQDKALAVLGDAGDAVIDDLLDLAAPCKKLLRGRIKELNLFPVEQNNPKEEMAVASLEELLAKLDDEAKEKTAKYPISVQKYAFKRLVTDAEKRMEEFEDMLTDVLNKPQYAGMSWEDAQSVVIKEPEFEALKFPQLRLKVYEVYQEKLKKRLLNRSGSNLSQHSNMEDKSIKVDGGTVGGKHKHLPVEDDKSRKKAKTS